MKPSKQNQSTFLSGAAAVQSFKNQSIIKEAQKVSANQMLNSHSIIKQNRAKRL